MRGGSLRSGAGIIAKCRDFQIARRRHRLDTLNMYVYKPLLPRLRLNWLKKKIN